MESEAVADRYRRLAAVITERVDAVPDDRWESPSPCEEWTARGVVGHLVDTSEMFLGLIGREAPPHPSVADDPAAAWAVVRDGVQAALDDPDAAGSEYDGVFGRTTFATTIDRFGCFDLLIHRWDLSVATGLDTTLEADEVQKVLGEVDRLGDALRSPGVCKDPLPVAGDADPQTRLLALLGRRA
jgi:uncharacterized protein (TIGR03086 family)